MACKECEGYWVCASGTPECHFFPGVDATDAEDPKRYVGRFDVDAGPHNIWARGTHVSICEYQPLSEDGSAWTQVGEIVFPKTAPYDVWIKPGKDHAVKIQEVDS